MAGVDVDPPDTHRLPSLTVSPTRSAQHLERTDAEIPTVSVVIATHGRHESLVRCLSALSEQTVPRRLFEVVVCDDGSSVPVAPAIAPFSDRIALTVVRRPRGGPAAARNEGARNAKGSLLA